MQYDPKGFKDIAGDARMAPAELRSPLNFADGGAVNWASDATVYNTQSQLGNMMATPGGFGGMANQFTSHPPFGKAPSFGSPSSLVDSTPGMDSQSQTNTTSQPMPQSVMPQNPVIGSFAGNEHNSVTPPLAMARGGSVSSLTDRLKSEFLKRGLDFDKFMAHSLARKGQNGDTILAHINPEEARLLKAHGGSGKINPHTGLPSFSEEGDAARGGDTAGFGSGGDGSVGGGGGYGSNDGGLGGGGDRSGSGNQGDSSGGYESPDQISGSLDSFSGSTQDQARQMMADAGITASDINSALASAGIMGPNLPDIMGPSLPDTTQAASSGQSFLSGPVGPLSTFGSSIPQGGSFTNPNEVQPELGPYSFTGMNAVAPPAADIGTFAPGLNNTMTDWTSAPGFNIATTPEEKLQQQVNDLNFANEMARQRTDAINQQQAAMKDAAYAAANKDFYNNTIPNAPTSTENSYSPFQNIIGNLIGLQGAEEQVTKAATTPSLGYGNFNPAGIPTAPAMSNAAANIAGVNPFAGFDMPGQTPTYSGSLPNVNPFAGFAMPGQTPAASTGSSIIDQAFAPPAMPIFTLDNQQIPMPPTRSVAPAVATTTPATTDWSGEIPLPPIPPADLYGPMTLSDIYDQIKSGIQASPAALVEGIKNIFDPSSWVSQADGYTPPRGGQDGETSGSSAPSSGSSSGSTTSTGSTGSGGSTGSTGTTSVKPYVARTYLGLPTDYLNYGYGGEHTYYSAKGGAVSPLKMMRK